MQTVTLTYLAFGETLHVLGAPSDSIRNLRPIGVFTPNWVAVRSARDRIRTQMHHAADSGELAAAALREVRGLSAFLFDELVPLQAKRWLRAGGGSLSLSLPCELLDLPWELLHTGNGFLSVDWAMGRVVQLVDDSEPARTVHGPPSILIVADPDGELHEAYDEGMALRAAFRAADETRVAFRAGDVDAAFLRRHAREYDIVHYAGHIDPDGWRMSESTFDRDAVLRLSGGAPLPALVFANGCSGAEGETFDASMLQAWLSGGVRHVLGPLFELPDRLGRLFALAFYARLAEGSTVGEAVRHARLRLSAELGEGATPWGAYVLYGEPDERYVCATAAPAPEPAARTGATRLRPSEPPAAEALRQAAHSTAQPVAIPRPRSAGDSLFAVILVLIVLLTAAAIALVAGHGPGLHFDDRSAPKSVDF